MAILLAQTPQLLAEFLYQTHIYIYEVRRRINFAHVESHLATCELDPLLPLCVVARINRGRIDRTYIDSPSRGHHRDTRIPAPFRALIGILNAYLKTSIVFASSISCVAMRSSRHVTHSNILVLKPLTYTSVVWSPSVMDIGLYTNGI